MMGDRLEENIRRRKKKEIARNLRIRISLRRETIIEMRRNILNRVLILLRSLITPKKV